MEFSDKLPEELRKKAKNYLEKQPDSSEAKILKRLVGDGAEMNTVFDNLRHKTKDEKEIYLYIYKIWAETINLYQLSPIDNKKYKALFDRISKHAGRIEEDLQVLISHLIKLPEWVEKPINLFEDSYSNYSESSSDKKYIQKKLERIRDVKKPISGLYRTEPSLSCIIESLKILANHESTLTPKYIWDELIEGKTPKKKNKYPNLNKPDLILFRKTLLIRKITKLTIESFGKPMAETVGLIVKVALNLQDDVSKEIVWQATKYL